MRTRLMKKTETQPFQGTKDGPCLKILTQITLEDGNELGEIREVFPQKITSQSFDNDNKLTLKSLFAFCSVFFFFLQGPTEERWKRLRERHNARFSKYSSVTLKS